MDTDHTVLQVEEDGYVSWGGASPIVEVVGVSKADVDTSLASGGAGYERARADMLVRYLRRAVLDGSLKVSSGQFNECQEPFGKR